MATLWDTLKDGDKVKLIQYLWDSHGLKMDWPTEDKKPACYDKLEPIEEIGRLMRQAPSRSRRGNV